MYAHENVGNKPKYIRISAKTLHNLTEDLKPYMFLKVVSEREVSNKSYFMGVEVIIDEGLPLDEFKIECSTSLFPSWHWRVMSQDRSTMPYVISNY